MMKILLTAACAALVTISNLAQGAAVSPPELSLPDAALIGDVKAIRQHVAARSNLNEKVSNGGGTPLIVAAVFGHTEAAQALIDAGADLNLRNDEGSTALVAAAFFAHTDIVKALLDAGADATLENNAGATPLAAVEGPFEAVKPIYDVVGRALEPLGLKLDYDRIQAERPKIAALLRERASSDASPAESLPKPTAKPGVSVQVSPSDWATYNHDVTGWRFNPAEKILGANNAAELVEQWRFPTEGSGEKIGVVHATPTVVSGEVYFGTATFAAFYKLRSDGTLAWMYRNPAAQAMPPPKEDLIVDAKLASAAGGGGIFSSALVANGSVYFADTAGWMYCLDAATGAERWKVNSRAPSFPDAHWMNLFMGSPIFADGKVIFVGGTLEQLIAGTLGYPGSTGRGFVVALNPETGELIWKFDVGPKPQKLDPPVVIEGSWGKYKFESGPATSSVWSTPSYDAESNTLFFGTDVNTAPRQPSKDNPALGTEDSCAIVALDAGTGRRKWNTQINPGDVWTNSQRAYDPTTGLYKDCSIGDTPKILTIELDGHATKVVGAGCKNGGFYLLRADNGKIVQHTPVYTGPPTEPPQKHDPRVLALPSPIGGLQTGCATDGRTIFCNGIDAVRLGTQDSRIAPNQIPTGGRVTAVSADLKAERWRHERPKISEIGGKPGKPMYRNVGDVVASGIALGNGVAFFTTVGSGKLVALDTATGAVLKEISIGPIFSGPSLSRGHVYVGGGNTLFTPIEAEAFFPKQYTGSVRCFGLPGQKSNVP